MTVPDPTTDDVAALANALREAERLGLIQADSIAHHVWPVIVERDARIRAEALREAADWLRDDMDEPWGTRAANRLDARADRIIAGWEASDDRP